MGLEYRIFYPLALSTLTLFTPNEWTIYSTTKSLPAAPDPKVRTDIYLITSDPRIWNCGIKIRNFVPHDPNVKTTYELELKVRLKHKDGWERWKKVISKEYECTFNEIIPTFRTLFIKAIHKHTRKGHDDIVDQINNALVLLEQTDLQYMRVDKQVRKFDDEMEQTDVLITNQSDPSLSVSYRTLCFETDTERSDTDGIQRIVTHLGDAKRIMGYPEMLWNIVYGNPAKTSNVAEVKSDM